MSAQLSSSTSAPNAAVSWAISMVGASSGTYGHEYWYGCLAFAVNAYEVGAQYPIRNQVTVGIGSNTYPSEIWNHFSGGTVSTDTSPPPGALVFWDSKGGTVDSHVAISIGNGTLISTNVDQSYVPGYTGIHRETLAQFAQNSWNIYMGWWLPVASPATSPAPATDAPAPVSQIPATPEPTSSAPSGSTSPARVGSPSGSDAVAGSNQLQPNAGSDDLQGNGSVVEPTSPSSAGPAPSPTPIQTQTPTQSPTPGQSQPPASSPTGPSPTVHPETVGGVSNTWTDYESAGGTQGPSVPAFDTIQIACKLQGFKVADGNTWWYRVAQSPWDNAYYVSADAFYNDGSTSGTLLGTPFVDPKVPNC